MALVLDPETVSSLDRFEAACFEFLETHASLRTDRAEAAELPTGIILFEEVEPEQERAMLDRCRRWQAEKFDAGFGWITGPVEYGGGGLSPDHQAAFDHLEQRFDVPGTGNLHMGFTTVSPSVAAFGTADQRNRLLPAIRRGDIVACQLFSEPGAGSDLAAIAARAERDGDDWIITGQKVWTSAAQHADVGELICRTDPSAPKHRGLTAFLIDLHSPGVDIRPLRQMTGGASFNEVFLDRVRVPDSARLGGEGEGWKVVMFSLDAERATIRDGQLSDPRHLDAVLEIARRSGRSNDPVLRQRLADLAIRDRVTDLLGQWIARSGGPPGPELALTKLALGANHRARAAVVSEILGVAVTAADSWPWAWSTFLLSVPAITIAGGTDEILRTLVAERVLGLPREPAPR